MRTAVDAAIAAVVAVCVVLAFAKLIGVGETADLPWSLVLLPLLGLGVGLTLVGAFVVAAIGFGALLMLADQRASKRE